MKGDSKSAYQTEAAYMLSEKPKRMLLNIKPQTEELAREWVGECNRLGVDQEITEHFVNRVQELKQD